MPVIQVEEFNGTPLEVSLKGRYSIFEAATSAAPDIVPPVVSVQTSAPIYRNTPVVVDVTDDKALALVEMYLVNADGSRVVIYSGADGFIYPFLDSTVLPITNGLRFTVQRAGGWLDVPTFKVRAIDGGLNEA